MSHLSNACDADQEDLEMGCQIRFWETQFHDLSLRIARLAISLGVQLKTPEQVHEAITLYKKTLDAQPTADERTLQALADSRSSIRNHKLMELGGLLMMRYNLERQCIEKIGPDATNLMLSQMEMELVRQGFELGADGINLETLSIYFDK